MMWRNRSIIRFSLCVLLFALPGERFAQAGDPPEVAVSDKAAILWEPGHEITVNIQPPNTGDATRDEAYNQAAEKALKQWNDYQAANFPGKGYKVSSTRDGKGTYDVTIQWVDTLPGDEGETKITAIHARKEGGIDIYRNTSATISLTRKTASGKPRAADAVQFLTQHEFGHAEGLNHVGEGKVMSAGNTFPKTDDAPASVDLNTDTSAKQAKSSIHNTKLDNNTNVWKLIKQLSAPPKKKLSYLYDPNADYVTGAFGQVGVRVSDPFLVVSDLPVGWQALYEPDTGLDDVTLNGANTFMQPGEGTGWLTLFATAPQYYATAATGFGFTVETSLDVDAFYGLDLYTLRADNNMTYYAVNAVPEPAAFALLSAGLLSIVIVRRSLGRKSRGGTGLANTPQLV